MCPDLVLFFNSPVISAKKDVFEIRNFYPRIGIASMASYLLQNGIDVRIIDPDASRLSIDQIKKMIEKTCPHVVGIPAYTEEINDAAKLAQITKEVDPNITTVVGGPHAWADPVDCLQEFSSFDIAAYGEGEQTILELAQRKPVEEILGIAFRRFNRIKLNEPRPLIKSLSTLPSPAWQLYDLTLYRGSHVSSGFKRSREKSLEIPLEGARGCPYGCIFCFQRYGRAVRFKSPSKVADEIEKDIEEFKATAIFFTEGTFGVSKKHATAVCDEIVKRGLHEKITWSTGARVDTVDKELLGKMKEAGCAFVNFGVESGSPEILKIVGKNIDLKQVKEAFRNCKELGIKTEANFIFGNPYDTEETILKTIEFSKKLEADHANFAILVPFPGTEVCKMADRGVGGLEIKTKDWRVYGKQIGAALELKNLPSSRLVQLQTRAYREFYLRPRKLPQLMEREMFKRVVRGLARYALTYLRRGQS